MRTLLPSLFVICACVGAFFLGTATGGMPAAAAQDRGPVRPKTGGGTGTGSPDTKAPAPLVYDGGSGNAASSNGILAVTGSYGVGTSVLYVIDTESKQLAVYEARGGSPAASRLFLVGARRIDLDLQLEGYNDLSEFDYREMRKMYADRGNSKKSDPAETAIPLSGGR